MNPVSNNDDDDDGGEPVRELQSLPINRSNHILFQFSRYRSISVLSFVFLPCNLTDSNLPLTHTNTLLHTAFGLPPPPTTVVVHSNTISPCLPAWAVEGGVRRADVPAVRAFLRIVTSHLSLLSSDETPTTPSLPLPTAIPTSATPSSSGPSSPSPGSSPDEALAQTKLFPCARRHDELKPRNKSWKSIKGLQNPPLPRRTKRGCQWVGNNNHNGV